jgi:hypothetical protein
VRCQVRKKKGHLFASGFIFSARIGSLTGFVPVVLTSDAAGVVRCQVRKNRTSLFASGFKNFHFFSEDWLIDRLCAGGTNLRRRYAII